MDFSTQFQRWLDTALADGVPGEVKAFSFNLFEPFGIELIGAERFDPEDPDWPCDEIWEPAQRSLDIPPNYAGENWEQCLAAMKALLVSVLDAGGPSAVLLKSRQGIGIGFVDGGLELLFP